MTLYLWTAKSKAENRLNIKYKFKKVNMEYNISTLISNIGRPRMSYVFELIHTMDSQNRIDFGILELPEWTLKKLRPFLLKNWVVWKFKLKWDWVKTYYLNPYYAHSGKTISKELFDTFDDINNNQIY